MKVLMCVVSRSDESPYSYGIKVILVKVLMCVVSHSGESLNMCVVSHSSESLDMW